VSGSSISITANATDNIGVVGVQFKLDGSNLSAEDTSAPFGITWDSTTSSNGSHAITATARDVAGNSTTSSVVTVNVNNTVTPPPPPPPSGTTMVASDNFNRAGANLGSNWTNVLSSPDIIIVNTKAYVGGEPTTNASAFWNANTFSTDQYSKDKWYGVSGGYGGVAVRMSGIGSSRNYYALATDSFSRWTIIKVINGVQTNLGNGSITWVDGDIQEVRVVGNTITAYRNGTLLGSATDSSLTSGNPGLYLQGNQADDWEGGNIGTSPTPTPVPTPTPLRGDLNLDHLVNSIDWSLMNSKWFTSDANADLNHDGLVNSIDFSLLNANWFKTW
jgi:hypothetical protein